MPLRLLVVLSLLAGIAGQSEAQKNPFANIRYDSVVAYNFNEFARVRTILNKDSTLDKSTVLPGKKLKPEHVKWLLTRLNDKNTYGGVVFACFDPRHSFLFYRGKSIVAMVEICFDCNTLRSNPTIPAEKYYYNKKGQESMNWGFSDDGLKWLMDFCKGLGLEVNPILGRPPKE